MTSRATAAGAAASRSSSSDPALAEAARLAEGLFPHQVEGVAFLLRRGRAILADDMGLGKTRQAVLALTQAVPQGPWLVVAPASVKGNWAREIELARPGSRVGIVGPNEPPAPGYDGWAVINYDILGRHLEALLAHRWAGFVFDEAHYLKNQSSKRSRNALRLVESVSADAPVYALTGTPLTSRPRDLFPLLRVIRHPLGRSFLSFAKRYCDAYHNGFGWVTDGASNLGELAVELHGALLRRDKGEVLDLPPKLRSWLPVEVPPGTALAEMQAVVLELLRSQAGERLGQPGRGGFGGGSAALLARITRARTKLAAAKVRATLDLVEGAVEQGEKVLVFSGFDAPIRKIHEHFAERSVLLTGATPAKARQGLVDRFQQDDGVRVFCANVVAGGVGLNLTAARHVVFNDLDWVPANHWQAEDRAYRIGQTGTVNIHYLVASGTIDDFVRTVLERKSALVGAVVEGEALTGGLDTDLLTELERALGALSPRLAGLTSEELETADLPSLLMEVADAWRRGEGETPEPGVPRAAPPGDALRALAEALRGPAPERYRVTSNSRPGLYYTLEHAAGDLLCSCPGFEYRGTCSHARKLKAALAGGGALPAGYDLLGADA